ncbi:MAG: sigma-70 family RNA polymerase sigma factor [Acholeplasmataceae bacterium]|jgi:RNA polymerase sporulation-specific sigma factor
MNDYELIYLVQNHQDGIALDFLFEKYKLLIWKYIHQYNVPYYEQEDFFQEGLLMLHKAIISFNEAKNKTFTRYFELILKRRFWALLKRLPKYVIKDIPEIQGSYILRETEIVIPDLKSKLELDIFEMYFVNNESISDISKKRGYKVKQIYNAIYRIREKILSK